MKEASQLHSICVFFVCKTKTAG